MPPILFYTFAVLAVLGALGVVWNRNPVSGAFSMIGCFVAVAALFVGLNAYFLGTIQVLVYTGAIMVLFLFIIMLLDLRAEGRRKIPVVSAGIAGAVGLGFVALSGMVLSGFEPGRRTAPELAADRPGDAHALGRLIFTEYHFPLQVIAVLLLVATVGVVVLSKKAAR